MFRGLSVLAAKKIYAISIITIILASVYPIYMGAVMLWSYFHNGGIDVADYPSYVIPYTPICIALIICVSLLPLIYKICDRLTLPVVSIMGAVIFIGAETAFEQVAVFTDLSSKIKVEAWQMLSCVMTPQVSVSVWDSLNIRFNPSFKIHFYAIALLIVMAIIGVVYGFYRIAHTKNYSKAKPLVIQLIAVAVFIGLCVLACFTAFFRTGNISLSPLSAVLMTLFFMIFGITAGVYAGTWLYGKQRTLSIIIPSFTAIIISSVMYLGEMIMMGWRLFQRGGGVLFERLGSLPFSAFDILTVLFSGVITYLILYAIKNKNGNQS